LDTPSTPASLLDRLRKPDETSAWERFVELYSPLLFHWARRLGLQASDAADLVQDAFLLLFRKLPEFQYDASRSFHAWLKTVFLNQHRARLRVRRPLLLDGTFPDAEDSHIESLEESEYRRYLVQQGFCLVQREFNAIQCEAFRQHVLTGRSAEEVARDLGLRPGTVYSVKSKVLSRLRQELSYLLD
jgi:RNA polymerase sigma-70 factor (ECF subfamily)